VQNSNVLEVTLDHNELKVLDSKENTVHILHRRPWVFSSLTNAQDYRINLIFAAKKSTFKLQTRFSQNVFI